MLDRNNCVRRIQILLIFGLFILFQNGWGSSRAAAQSLDLNVPSISAPVKINGKQTIYYELHLTNSAKDSIALKKLEVIDAADSELIASFNENDLRSRFSLLETPPPTSTGNTLPPNTSGVIFLELTLKKDSPNIRLMHRLEATSGTGSESKLVSLSGASISLTKQPEVILGPPLREGFWAAVYNPFWIRGHRRVFYTINGKTRLPGRFAIDFIRLDNEGRYAAADENFIKNWFGYGNEVIAVKDGVIASTSDVFSESLTVSGQPKYPPEKATGNYISINIGNNLVAFYEHLKPGSLRVKPGQKVKKGDVLALVGFTGQTTGPHLHFHVASENSPLGAEGVSFAFEKFTLVGTYPDFETFGKMPWIPSKNSSWSIVFRERPAPNSVIQFQSSKQNKPSMK